MCRRLDQVSGFQLFRLQTPKKFQTEVRTPLEMLDTVADPPGVHGSQVDNHWTRGSQTVPSGLKACESGFFSWGREEALPSAPHPQETGTTLLKL